jgi:hypothetical protein
MCESGRAAIVIWRDITQINASGYVLFSADTPRAEFWMRRQYGGPKIVFGAPAEDGNAEAFRKAADAANFTIVALKRMSANR